MVEGGRSSSEESDSDLLLSGSVCYKFSNDHKELSEGPLLYHGMEEVHPYLFEPEWPSSSEPDTETPDIVNYWEERIGNADWYLNMASMVKLAALQTVFTGVPAIFVSPCQQLASPRTRQHYTPSSWRPNPIMYHAAHRL